MSPLLFNPFQIINQYSLEDILIIENPTDDHDDCVVVVDIGIDNDP